MSSVISSGVGSGTNGLSKAGQLGVSALSGAGLSTAMNGGNFWENLAISSVVVGLNHLIHKWQEKEFWDLNGDGHLQKSEVDAHYRGASGRSITVDVSEVDIKLSDLVDIGWNTETKTKNVQTLFRKNGKIYGNVTLHKVGSGTYEILPDVYNFEQHGDHWYSSPIRNPATAWGGHVASDYGKDRTTRDFKIHFKGTIKVPTSNAPKWRFF